MGLLGTGQGGTDEQGMPTWLLLAIAGALLVCCLVIVVVGLRRRQQREQKPSTKLRKAAPRLVSLPVMTVGTPGSFRKEPLEETAPLSPPHDDADRSPESAGPCMPAHQHLQSRAGLSKKDKNPRRWAPHPGAAEMYGEACAGRRGSLEALRPEPGGLGCARDLPRELRTAPHLAALSSGSATKSASSKTVTQPNALHSSRI